MGTDISVSVCGLPAGTISRRFAEDLGWFSGEIADGRLRLKSCKTQVKLQD